jgi:hypothetical protein
MDYKNEEVKTASAALMKKLEAATDKRAVLRAPELGALYERLKTLPGWQAKG